MKEKILVLGTGYMGRIYINNLNEHLGIDQRQIVGVDINSERFTALSKEFPEVEFIYSQADQPLAKFINFNEVGSVFLCTNTPSHHRLLVELMQNGIRNIFCEKPLALNMEGVNAVRKEKLRTGTHIFTAFLMNFSPAVMHIIERMRAENLVLIQGEASWGKNRMYDPRPTPGDLEDESVHPIGVFHTLLQASGLEINAVYVGARLSWLDYIDPEVQRKAHEVDPSFPLRVNSSAFINEEVHCSSIPFPILLHTSSSYVKGKQVRRVECTLAKHDNPIRPHLAIEFNFDTPAGDILEITRLAERKAEEPLSFRCQKIAAESEAFLNFVESRTRDPRLTDYLEARMSVKVTDAIVESDKMGGCRIQAIGEEHILLRRIINGN